MLIKQTIRRFLNSLGFDIVRYHNSPAQTLLGLRQFLKFWHHLKYHRDIVKHTLWTKVDARRFEFYKSLIGSSDLVFDVGANMGNRSKIFSAIGAQVVAFEPQSHCARFLEAAFSGDAGITLVTGSAE